MERIEIVIFKLFLAAVVGFILGIERETKHKPLGLRTCIVVSIVSCLLTIVSIEFVVNPYRGTVFTGADPLRLAAQIVSGIGFLGAGVILRRDNNIVYGLTTAAIVWAASGFGITIGAGYYLEAALGTGFIYFTVSFLPVIVRKLGATSLKEQEVYLKISLDPEILIETVIGEIEASVIRIENIKIKGDNEGHRLEIRCFINGEKDNIIFQYEKIRKITGINRIEITEM